MKKKRLKGQLMLITLLVLTIISLLVVGLVVLVNRDATQVVSSAKYEEAYNTAESQLNILLEQFGQPGISLTTIPGNSYLGSNGILCLQSDAKNVSCTVTQNSSFSSRPLDTKITISDQNYLDEYEVFKDRSFDINLSNYSGELEFNWNKSVAIDFALVYLDSSSNWQIIRDIFDSAGVFPAVITHTFGFIPDVSDPNTVRFTIGTISNLPAGANSMSLRVTPRLKSTNLYDSILLSMTASSQGLPDQVRVFDSKSYDPTDSSTAVAEIKTKIPLNAQGENAFDYSLITNNVITNN